MTTGILGVQGCIEPHEQMLANISQPSLRVRTPEDLDKVDRLILPGGESTTMLRFLTQTGLSDKIKKFAESKPIWGICAGAILLAKEVLNPSQASLGLINIRAYRNFYGSQLDSFTHRIEIKAFDKSIEAHFIRAPRLEVIENKNIEILAEVEQTPVFFRHNKIWACSFHVELGKDPSLHQVFVNL